MRSPISVRDDKSLQDARVGSSPLSPPIRSTTKIHSPQVKPFDYTVDKLLKSSSNSVSSTDPAPMPPTPLLSAHFNPMSLMDLGKWGNIPLTLIARHLWWQEQKSASVMAEVAAREVTSSDFSSVAAAAAAAAAATAAAAAASSSSSMCESPVQTNDALCFRSRLSVWEGVRGAELWSWSTSRDSVAERNGGKDRKREGNRETDNRQQGTQSSPEPYVFMPEAVVVSSSLRSGTWTEDSCD